MNIQIVTNQNLTKQKFPSVTYSSLREPQSLDEFDVVIIDLSAETIWRNLENNTTKIKCYNDFLSIAQMVTRRKNAIIVYALPQNTNYSYNFSFEKYQRSIPLKDHLPTIRHIMEAVFPPSPTSGNISIYYEKTRTQLNDVIYNADFYFDGMYDACTSSISSEKSTTIRWTDTVYFTTLNILKTEAELRNFLSNVLPEQEKEAIPSWMETECYFNDRELKRTIEENEEKIEIANQNIEIAQDKLKENERYKSILYTSGDELTEVVFSILEKILSCSLSSFVDEKHEDFLIKKEKYTLIGEIKGVNSNVRNENIGQIDLHYQKYKDRLNEENLVEEVHQILIMNTFRKQPLAERKPIHEDQIKLAERNGCLIIETTTLLKLFEKYVAGDVTVETCERLFTEKTGLLKESDF